MGNISELLGMIPGMNRLNLNDSEIDEGAMAHVEAIIYSMTPRERRNPDILNGSRKKRIAGGCGRPIQEINRLLKQFDEMKKMMKSFTGKNKGTPGGGLPLFK